MFTERKKTILSACLFLGLLLVILGCEGTSVMPITPGSSYEGLPRRKMDITIDTSRRQEFFDQLRNFATKQGFTIRIDTRTSGSENFLVYMTRGGIEISGANVFAPGEYEFGFYDVYQQPPATESVLDDLVSDLKNVVSAVPGANFFVVP